MYIITKTHPAYSATWHKHGIYILFILLGFFYLIGHVQAQPQPTDWPSYGIPQNSINIDNNKYNQMVAPPLPGTESYNFRIPTPDQAANTNFSNYPNNYGYIPPQSGQYTQPSPQFEVEITNNHPYIQENLILTFRVISATSLEQMDPVLPQTQAFTFQRLLQPTAYTVPTQGPPQIVNEMHYMVTPLNAGRAELQLGIAITLPANSANQSSSHLTLQAPNPLILTVKPQISGVLPWLPLEQLAIKSNLDTLPNVAVDKPITLVLKILAAGALGNQLPSLERQLNSPDFRVYRGKTEIEEGPSQDFRHIMSIRTEQYTIVPQYNGTLRLPPLQISWFNLHTETPTYSSIQLNELTTKNVYKTPQEANIYHWFYLFGLLLLTLGVGYWIGAGYQNIWEFVPMLWLLTQAPRSKAIGAVAKLWNITVNWLNPSDYLTLAATVVVSHAANRLPLSIRFWTWVHTANLEQSPELWRKTLQTLSWRALAIPPYVTSSVMAQRIVYCLRLHKQSEKLYESFKILDSANYGQQAINFSEWKQNFESQVKPRLSSLFTALTNQHARMPKRLLPLNPDLI